MYRKTHRRLAFFFAGISSLLLVALSFCYQLLSERETRNASFPAFSGEMSTLSANLNSQTTITHEWLATVSAGGKYLLAFYDNDVPFAYNSTVLTTVQQEVIEEVLTANREIFDAAADSSYYDSTHREFSYRAGNGLNYYVSFCHSRRPQGILSAVILFSTEEMEMRFLRQRLVLLCLNLAGIVVLFLFSYFFTGHLLRPIKKSREQQAAFVAAASHELRTPVSVILSSASALKYAKAAEQPPFLSTIESEALRMSRLINDLLTLSRSDNQNWAFHMEPVELDTMLLNLYEAYSPIAAKESISLSLLLPDHGLPPCCCDRDRITQVLGILLSNGISYNKKGGCVTLRLEHCRHEFCIQVIDTGAGISPEARKHIFERFYRGDQARSEKGHFGLGLSIAKDIIQAHHGKILLSDTPGGGTTFTVLLPQSL